MIIEIDQLNRTGWIEVEGIASQENLLELACSVGTLLPLPDGSLVEDISPSSEESSRPGTLSNRFGYGNFPLHSDTAHWSVPARYVVMCIIERNYCDTLVINVKDIFNSLNKDELDCVRSATYLISTFEGKKYTSPLLNINGVLGFKYDPACMMPANKSAKVFHRALIDALSRNLPHHIKWSGNKAVVIDNWAALHGRAEITDVNLPRRLLRVYVR